MTGMVRGLFTLASGALLLLCAATAVLWARSHSRLEHWAFTRGTTTWGLTSFAGSCRFLQIEGTPCVPGVERRSFDMDWTQWAPDVRFIHPLMGAQLPQPRFGFLASSTRGGLNPCGIRTSTSRLNNWTTARLRVVVVPYWFLLACFVMPSSFTALRMLTRCLRPPGWQHERHCRRCGYDLRATQNRCPECGTVPSFATVKA